MNKCSVCKSTNLREDKYEDIRCLDCQSLLRRIHRVDGLYELRKDMDIKRIKSVIENCIYQAAIIIETLEHMGFYHGNGHHAAQSIAQFAVERFMKGYKNT